MFPLRPRNYLSLLLSFKERLLLDTLYPLTIMQTILVGLITFVWLISLPGVRFLALKVRISNLISYPLTIMQTILVGLITFVWLISLPGVRFHSLKVRISSLTSYHTPFTPPL